MCNLGECIRKFEVYDDTNEIIALIDSECVLEHYQLQEVDDIPEDAKNSIDFINLDDFFTIPLIFVQGNDGLYVIVKTRPTRYYKVLDADIDDISNLEILVATTTTGNTYYLYLTEGLNYVRMFPSSGDTIDITKNDPKFVEVIKDLKENCKTIDLGW